MKSSPVVCTRESMSRMKIENDSDGFATEEWMAFNIAYCSRAGYNHNTQPAIMPKKDSCANAFRLSPCGTQPTRGISGYNEKIITKGQTFRYNVPISDLSGCVLTFGCDGIEDNGAITADKIHSVATSFDKFKELLDDNNILFRNWNNYHSKINGYPKNGTFCEKLIWMRDYAFNIKINDKFWKDSVSNSASKLLDICENSTDFQLAFTSRGESSMSTLINAFIELCNVRGSADNVTFGMIKYF